MVDPTGGLRSIAAAQQRGARGIEVWAVDPVGQIWTLYQLSAGGGWSAWEGPGFKGQPTAAWQVAAADQNTGCAIVFMLDLDGAVRCIPQSSPGGDWGAWSSAWLQNQPQPFLQIAAAQQGGTRGVEVWAVDLSGQIWTLYQLTPGGAWSAWEGPGFKGQPGPVSQIAAAGQNTGAVTLFALDAAGAVWSIGQTSPGGDWGPWSGPNLAGQPKPLTAIAAAQQGGARGVELWGVDADGQVWTLYQLTPGGAWSHWEGPGFKGQLHNLGQIAAAGQNTGNLKVLALQAGGALWAIDQLSPGGDWGPWNGLPTPPPAQMSGWNVVGSGAARVFAGGRLLFAVDAQSLLSVFAGAPGSWTALGGPAHDYAGTEQGVYSITQDKSAVMALDLVTSQWSQIGGAMERLIAARRRLHAIDAAGQVWMYAGTPNSWTALGGPFRAVDANDAFCFAVAADGQSVVMLPGGTTTWVTIGGPMVSLVAAGDALYGVDASGAVYQYSGVPMQWTRIGGGFAQLSAWGVWLYALTADKSSVLRYRTDLKAWQPVAGGADAISAGAGFVAAVQAQQVSVCMPPEPAPPPIPPAALALHAGALEALDAPGVASPYNWLVQIQTADQAFAGYDGEMKIEMGFSSAILPRTSFDRGESYLFTLHFYSDAASTLALRGGWHWLPDHWTISGATAWSFSTGKLYVYETDPKDVPNENDHYNWLTLTATSVRDTPVHTGPATVYIWNYEGLFTAVGHASLKLSDGTYLSWWPRGVDRKYLPFLPLVYRAPHANPQTYQDDRDLEEKDPDIALTLWNLDEAAIKAWWAPYNANVGNDWWALGRNCSTVVFYALKAGGALNVLTTREQENWENIVAWTPSDIEALLLALQSKQ